MRPIAIDLGELPGEDVPDAPEPRAPVPVRWLLGALTVLLLILLGGASWTPAPALIPAGLADSMQIVGDRLYVIHPVDARRVITTYGLPRGNKISTVTLDVGGDIVGLVPVGQELLVTAETDGFFTGIVVAVGLDGRQLWRQNGELMGEVDGNALINTSDGTWFAVGVSDGVRRWSVPGRADGYNALDGEDGVPTRLFTLEGQQLIGYDVRTGKAAASVQLPTGHGFFWVVGDLVLVDVGGTTVAYGKDDLKLAWRSGVDLGSAPPVGGCGAVICAFREQAGMIAINPVNGSIVWDSPRWAFAMDVGGRLVADQQGPPTGAVQWVLDEHTGSVLGDFGDWVSLGDTDASGKQYGLEDQPGNAIKYGILDARTLGITVLGAAADVSGGCQIGVDARVLACRKVDSSVVVIPLR